MWFTDGRVLDGSQAMWKKKKREKEKKRKRKRGHFICHV